MAFVMKELGASKNNPEALAGNPALAAEAKFAAKYADPNARGILESFADQLSAEKKNASSPERGLTPEVFTEKAGQVVSELRGLANRLQGKELTETDIPQLVDKLRQNLDDSTIHEVVEKLQKITEVDGFDPQQSEHFGGGDLGLITLLLELLKETWTYVNSEVK